MGGTVTRKRYPFSISYYSEGEVTVADNGDKAVSGGSWSAPEACDAVPASDEARRTVFEDGHVDSYLFLIILPAGGHRYAVGERVRLSRYGLTEEYTVKGFMEYQFRRHVAV